LIRFIQRAKDSTFALRAAMYEFHYDPVGAAFKAALDRKVDVKILYDDPNYGTENRKMINHVGLSRVCAPRTSAGAPKHTKVDVVVKRGAAVEVWPGHTNIPDGGIVGHSNVGHSVRSGVVAGQYLAYWNALCNAIQPPPGGTKPFSATRTDPGTSGLTTTNN